MVECSHCGRPISADEEKKLRRERGNSPLLCKLCAPTDDENNGISEDDI